MLPSRREPTSVSRIHDLPGESAPPAEARYFYASALQIDDPFAPVPSPLTSLGGAPKEAPHPFSSQDNEAIDLEWNRLRKSIKEYEENVEKERIKKLRQRDTTSPAAPRWQPRAESRTESLSRDVSTGRRLAHTMLEAKQERGESDLQKLLSKAKTSLGHEESMPSRDRSGSGSIKECPESTSEDPLDTLKSANAAQGNFDIGESEQGTTGRPFVRAPSRTKAISGSWDEKVDSTAGSVSSATPQTSISRKQSTEDLTRPGRPLGKKLPVGVQKLHQISMPDLRLEPIYWSPVNDVAEVMRATWFYQDTMLPVETDVANMLEQGYLTVRPWTKTWGDELNSAVEVGPLGEEKIAHTLWPSLPARAPSSRPGTATSSKTEDADDTPESRKATAIRVVVEAIDNETLASAQDHKAAGVNVYGNDGQPRSYSQCKVIYADGKHARILRPNLAPSAYYGRKPYANYIRKGHKLGVAVIRGFSQTAWDQLHQHNKSAKSARISQNSLLNSREQQATPSPAWLSDPPTRKSGDARVTDLILVMHGIGQKYSERNESYHFTHAMNAFRREVNVDLNDSLVRPMMRKTMGGVMVLPVNWRSTLSFEDGGYRDEPEQPGDNAFTLKDITPDTLPHVRNVISDVMLDIPYYLSHHQPRMIAAAIREANRIHRLWCRNNPGFEQYGRVHILAHSLGSVMAIDILSKQPTRIEESITPFEGDEPEHLMFNTRNLYLCGSPAGFFLLLRKAGLRPRKDGEKGMGESQDTDAGVWGEEGSYGCIAVDNVYNIVNPYDPVAYRMNAALDSAYSDSLKPAFVPRVSDSWFSFGSSSKSAYHAAGPLTASARPGTAHRLPSTVELETHNFTREEMAEKRAFLLNDNGQIDYFLRYGGGPLEIQYLTMLGAHSSYWLSKDFIRFLVVETGRESGRPHAIEALKATKKKTYAR